MPGPDQTRYYVTTPIYYVNDAPHIGHAYTTIACDVLARFKRLDGTRVHFLTGTDDHGQKVEKSARAAGMEPQAFTDQVSGNFRRLAQALNYTNDDFIRTTEPRHKRACQAIWRKLMEAGEIYLGTYAGWYAVRDEAFYGENELTKQPDGSFLAPSGAPVEWVEEPSYFFRLSAWGDRLLELYECQPDFVLPESRRNEVIAFVKSGLRELAEALCLYRAHPREVVRLHMEVLREKSKVAPPPRSNALIAEGRLLVLELMGDVAALYRRYAYGPAPRPRPEKE